MPSDRCAYSEIVNMPGWVWFSLALMLALTVVMFLGLREAVLDEAPSLIWLWDVIWLPSIAVLVVLPLLLARLDIRVDEDRIQLRFGLIGVVKKEIPRALVERAEAVNYRPIRQFGGWGIRWGRFREKKTAAYSIRGSTGVLLVLSAPVRAAFVHTDHVLIGSLDASRLADVLSHATAGGNACEH